MAIKLIDKIKPATNSFTLVDAEDISYKENRLSISLEGMSTELVEVSEGLEKATPRSLKIALLKDNWKDVISGDITYYALEVIVAGVTESSRVDLLLTAEMLAKFQDLSTTFVALNTDGLVIVYAIGDRPNDDYTLQATIVETVVENIDPSDTTGIVGNSTGVTVNTPGVGIVQSDWNEVDPTQPDYIKNKPSVLETTGGTLTGVLYTSAGTPLFIGTDGKIGMRAATPDAQKEALLQIYREATGNQNANLAHVGQMNISNSWWEDGDQWGAQISGYNGKTGKYNELRVSHLGVEYKDETDTYYLILHSGDKGVANGLATLDEKGIVPNTQLPDYTQTSYNHSLIIGENPHETSANLIKDIAQVAISGDYKDLNDKPTLGTLAFLDAIDYNDLNNIPSTFTPSLHTHDYIPIQEKGTSNGVATLDENGKIPSPQLPSYVDDVEEYTEFSDFPDVGESGKIYIALLTNKTYRWSGSTYTIIGTDLALGETSSTAYYGDKGKTAYEHSQLTHGNPHGTVATDITGFADVAISGNYNDLKDIPTTFPPSAHTHDDLYIPLTQKSKFATLNENGIISNNQLPSNIFTHIETISGNPHKVTYEELEGNKPTIPTKISELTNDIGYITSTSVDSVLTNLNNHINDKSNPHDMDLTLLGVNATATELNYVQGVTNNIQALINKKVDDFSIEIYNGTDGNPKPVRFASFNYSTCNSENGLAAKISMVSGHGNGTSYAFLLDSIIRVNHLGQVEVDNFKYYGATTDIYDGVARLYGDIFWLTDTTNKIVDFYCLMGQYARVYQTPWKRLTYSSGGTVTLYNTCVVYSSGEKTWANNSNIALRSDIFSKTEVWTFTLEDGTTITKNVVVI